MHGCNVHVLPTVYVHLRCNQLCLHEYSSKQTFQHHFVCIMRREIVLTCCEMCFLCVVCFSVCAQKTGPNWVLSCVVRFIHMPALLLLPHTDILKLNVLCAVRQVYFSLCPTGSYLTSYAADSSWMNLFPNRPSLTFSSRFYSLTKMSIDLRHNFCHSKRVFVRYRLVVVSEKKCRWRKLWRKLFVNKINTGNKSATFVLTNWGKKHYHKSRYQWWLNLTIG